MSTQPLLWDDPQSEVGTENKAIEEPSEVVKTGDGAGLQLVEEAPVERRARRVPARVPSLKEAFARGFDLVVANPPFGNEIRDANILCNYELGKAPADAKKSLRGKVTIEILFVELMLRAARPGGRVATIVPNSILANATSQYMRDWLLTEARLHTSISLSAECFKPYTGAKTGIIYFQRWNESEGEHRAFVPRSEDYVVFMAMAEKCGQDSRCNIVYRRNDAGGLLVNDRNELTVDTDYDKTIEFFEKLAATGMISEGREAAATVEAADEDETAIEAIDEAQEEEEEIAA